MLDPDSCYAAVQRRDARFDGLFFTAVRTTRIYCRPICPARTPLRKNVSFHATAAEAQGLGFRPCLRCRPESAPDSPAWSGSLASVNRALRRIEEGALAEGGVEALAEGLGMTGRHLRRLFVQHLGVGPLAIEATRRLHLAKALLHQTRLPVAEVAFAAGYASLRRFNEAFLAAFGRPPTALRREGVEPEASARVRLRLGYRPPFDWPERLAAHPRAPGERREGGVLCGELEEGGFRLRQGPGRSLELELEGVPLRHFAHVVARVKRDFLWDVKLGSRQMSADRGEGLDADPPDVPRSASRMARSGILAPAPGSRPSPG